MCNHRQLALGSTAVCTKCGKILWAMHMSVTHIAGIVVKIDGRVIQRCGVCGEKLVDSLNSASCDGGPVPVWKEHSFVNISGNRMSVSEPTIILPEDHCLPLVEY